MDEPRTVDAVDPDVDDSASGPRATNPDPVTVGRRDTAEAQMPDKRSDIMSPESILMADFVLAIDETGHALKLQPAMRAIERYKETLLAEAGAAVPRDLRQLIEKWRLTAAALRKPFPGLLKNEPSAAIIEAFATDLEEALKP